MMRVLFILAIIVSLSLAVGTVIIASSVEHYRYEVYNSYSDYDSPGSGNYNSEAEDLRDSMTMTGAIFSALCLAFLEFAFVLGLVKIKTKTMKVISIIGISLTGIALLLTFLPMTSPGNVSFDEIGMVFLLMAVIALALSIVGVVQAFKTKT